MKTRAIAFLLVLAVSARAWGQTVTPASTAPQMSNAYLAARSADQLRLISEGWQFHKGPVPDANVAASAGDDWEPISLPHTWNAKDGQDGGNDYFRGECWYRKHLTVDAGMAGKALFLRFRGVNRKADVYVNGQLLGSHAGGQSAFCFNATDALKPGDNIITVKASNRIDQDMPPLQADFTFFGGIYRPVELLVLNPVHISPMDYASSGVYVATSDVTLNTARITVRTLVQNDAKETAQITVSGQIFDGEQEVSRSVDAGSIAVKGGKTQEVNSTLTLQQPHLWDGRRDPHLYKVRMSVRRGDNVLDTVEQPLGVRTFSVDPAKGFILNGRPYDVHGVNRHQDRQDKGWAISEADHLEDMALIKEMGCTGIRLAHYEHADFFYGLCDQEGMVVWAEIPVVDRLATGANAEAFTQNARQQYIELIRQNFNHPSICFWSAGNEVDPPAAGRGGPDVFGWFRAMSALEHKEDPSRLSTSAWRERFFPPADMTDVYGLNEYLGWYTGDATSGWEGLEKYIAQHSQGDNKGKWAVSEYGAGASIYFHSEKPVRMDHSEEYQCLLHENTWRVLNAHPEIWGKFIWNMFDFAVDGRAEGDHAGRNNKGMVTYDRKVKKDVFYFYKAVWSPEPTLHIAGKRFAVRGLDQIPVKIYTNVPHVALTVNGAALSEKSPENGAIVWENVPLNQGNNDVVAKAVAADGKNIEDRCQWTYTPGAPLEIDEAQDEKMRQELSAGPPRAR